MLIYTVQTWNESAERLPFIRFRAGAVRIETAVYGSVALRSLPFNADVVGEIWQSGPCMSVLVHVLFCVCVVTPGKPEERQKMNILYGNSKILHGPSAREDPRAECLWLPNIINNLCAFTSSCCVWPAMSLRRGAGIGVVCLFMNTNYTSFSLSLNVSLLFAASPRLLAVRSGEAWVHEVNINWCTI